MYVAYHVGRVGEVAGGMTQVLNAYAKWSFSDFAVKIVTSRNGERLSFSALRLFARAIHSVASIDRAGSVVVVHLSQGGSFIREGMVLFVASMRGIPTVAQLHGSSFADFADKARLLVRFILSRAEVIHVLSSESYNAVCNLSLKGEIVQVPNAVTRIPSTAKEKLVVFGGSVSKRKGVEDLLEAWRLCGLPSRGWKLVVIGPLTDAVLPRELPEQVHLLGGQAHSILEDHLSRSSVAVLPSYDEAMPMFILEAMSARNVVIGTNVGGVPDLLENGRGVLVNPGDVVSLARALDEAGRCFGEDAGAAAAEYFDANYSPEVIIPRLEKAWRTAISRASSKDRTDIRLAPFVTRKAKVNES